MDANHEKGFEANHLTRVRLKKILVLIVLVVERMDFSQGLHHRDAFRAAVCTVAYLMYHGPISDDYGGPQVTPSLQRDFS